MLKKRNLDFPIDELIALDKRRRELIFETQEIKQKKNNLANSISIKKKNNDDTNAELEEMRAIGRKIVSIDQEKMTIELRFRRLIMMLPNIIDKSVPIGNDETNNLIIKPEGGSKKKISFKPKDHVDIATNLDLIDLERAAKISGARFYFLKNELVMMNQALINYALDFLVENGYQLFQPPFMLKNNAIKGSIIMDDFKDVIYKIENEDLYMISTSEHAMASMH